MVLWQAIFSNMATFSNMAQWLNQITSASSHCWTAVSMHLKFIVSAQNT